MFINRIIGKHKVIYLYDGILIGNIMGGTTDVPICNMDDTQTYYARWIYSDTKEYIFYDSTSMRCPDKGRSRQKGDEWSPAATPVGKKVLTTKGRSFEENRNILKLD